MKFFINISSFLFITVLYAELIDDFSDLTGSKDHGSHHTFKNSHGDRVYVIRILEKDLYTQNYSAPSTIPPFTFTRNNLYYNGSSKARGNLSPHKLSYSIRDDFNMLALSNLKINFIDMSKPFLADIAIKSSLGRDKYIKNYQFSPEDLNPTINIITSPGVDRWGFNVDYYPEDEDGDPDEEAQWRTFKLFGIVNEISFTMNIENDPYVNFNMSSIEVEEAVPEPFSLVSLVTGVATFVRKRKKDLSQSKFYI